MMKAPVLVVLCLAVVVCQAHVNLTTEQSEKEKRLPHDSCGRTPLILTPTIVGGKPAQLGEFPWMALIGYRIKESALPVSWGCGGSLITNRHVLTAAHCVHPDDLKVIRGTREITFEVTSIRLGELNHDDAVEDGAHPEDYEIEEIINHEGWNRTIIVNDIAIIKLKRQVEFTDYVRPICLPPSELRSLSLSTDDYPTVAGWGRTSTRAPGSKKLMKVQVRVVEHGECRANLTEHNPDDIIVIDQRVICASLPGKSSCMGDSGGPIMYFYQTANDTTEGRWYQIGIVSFGPDSCASEDEPDVYTRVAEFMPWILNQLDI